MGNYIVKAIIENYNQPKQNYNKSKNKFIAKFEQNNYDTNFNNNFNNNYHNKNVRNINYANKQKND
tara:strand:+ start:9 stop:206 length:198 start_codon:yes stop_codon:yes gene_type:complete